jgi:hypothetical protein
MHASQINQITDIEQQFKRFSAGNFKIITQVDPERQSGTQGGMHQFAAGDVYRP